MMLTLVLMLEMPVSLGALREQMVALMVLRVASVELVKLCGPATYCMSVVLLAAMGFSETIT